MRRLFSGIKNLLRRKRVDRDLDAEVLSYRSILEDEHMAKGLQPPDARRAANVNLGGSEQVKELVREARAGAWFESFWRDVRFAARVLRKSPAFTSVAIPTLAIGIGANVAIFSIVYGVLLRPIPYPNADRLAAVYMHFSPQNSDRGTMCMADYLDWKAQNHTFEDPQIYASRSMNLTGIDRPQQFSGAAVSAGFFTTLGVRPIEGREFLQGDDSASATPIAVISESVWRGKFSGDPGIIGRGITLNGSVYTVIGVMPAAFHYPQQNSQIWTNLKVAPPSRRGPFFFRGFGRLKPGVTLAQAQADTNAIGTRIEQANPYYKNLTLPVWDLRESIVGRVRFALMVMFGAVLFVLLIASVNIANLLLSRAAAREREMAVRRSMGATRSRLARQLLVESALLSLIGAAAGIFLAWAGVQLLRGSQFARTMPRMDDVRLEWHVLTFAVALALFTGIAFGLLPSLRASRGDISRSLNEGGRSRTQSSSHRALNSSLVIAEIAMSLVLLVGAGLFVRSFDRLQRVDPGFQAPPESVIYMTISPNAKKYSDSKIGLPYMEAVLRKVQAIPGVDYAAFSDSLPPDQLNDYDTFVIQGQSLPPGEENPAVPVVTITLDYFRALGIPLRSGRVFTEADAEKAAPVVLISESLAKQYYPSLNPLGRRFKASGTKAGGDFMEIVGVVGDTVYWGLDQDRRGAYYLPLAQNFGQFTNLIVRSRTESALQLASAIRSEVASIDRDTILGEVHTLDESMNRSVSLPRFRTNLLAGFAIAALLLAAIGVYGVISYSVTQRTNEIGIRVALGAQRRDVFRQILGQGMRLAITGSAIGLGVAFVLARYLSTLLFGIGPHDVITFAGTSLVLVIAAAAACWIPAHRAMNVDPMVALRHE
ncbi:MAG TPA: ABC transporter permease [Candidatus Acidoferrales bacterium]|nr:ABC transporter permease [Candidatus Acidoferrales bacterium]